MITHFQFRSLFQHTHSRQNRQGARHNDIYKRQFSMNKIVIANHRVQQG